MHQYFFFVSLTIDLYNNEGLFDPNFIFLFGPAGGERCLCRQANNKTAPKADLTPPRFLLEVVVVGTAAGHRFQVSYSRIK